MQEMGLWYRHGFQRRRPWCPGAALSSARPTTSSKTTSVLEQVSILEAQLNRKSKLLSQKEEQLDRDQAGAAAGCLVDAASVLNRGLTSERDEAVRRLQEAASEMPAAAAQREEPSSPFAGPRGEQGQRKEDW